MYILNFNRYFQIVLPKFYQLTFLKMDYEIYCTQLPQAILKLLFYLFKFPNEKWYPTIFLPVQLTFELHRFEQCGSSYKWIFFSINMYCSITRLPVGWICGWRTTNKEGWRADYEFKHWFFNTLREVGILNPHVV